MNEQWYAKWRIDTEEFFTTDDYVFSIETTSLLEAAKVIQEQIGSFNTLIELKRMLI